MRIAFIHYHLKSGGVTTVLKQQVESILDICDVMVLSGSLPEMEFPCDVVQIPELGYDMPDRNRCKPEQAAATIIEAIRLKWKSGCDLLHVHNPTLAKNKIFLKILKILQQNGIRLFLQIHDFAEDGRPLAYFYEEDYVSDCHYGVINSRDYNLLLKSGLRHEGLHKIFNMIRLFETRASEIISKNFVLYPIRAIRRKNIGEAILLSLFFKNNETLVITLPPNSPMDIKSYAGWKTFVNDNHLNIIFDAGLTHEFEDLVRSANLLITTSINEGFGFSFLEPWTAQKMLWGRKLPEICRDFEKNGVLLDHLYARLDIPLEWLDKKNLFKIWRACVRRATALFDTNIDERAIKKGFERLTTGNIVDFGLLNEAFQKKIISKTASDAANRHKLIHLNPFLLNPGSVSNADTLIQNNMKVVKRRYNRRKYKETLLEIYSKVLENNVCQKIDKKILLSNFLTLDNFSLLKWCDYDEK